MAVKYVYDFGEGNKEMKALLGGKGANLAEMTRIGLPVPPGFTITTEVCNYYSAEQRLPRRARGAGRHGAPAPRGGHRQDASATRPTRCSLSVRSGARASMPGMMDTILNLGLNDATAQGMVELTGNPRFAYDSLPPLRARCTATSCSAASPSTRTRPTPSRRSSSDQEGQGRRLSTPSSRPTTSRSSWPRSRRPSASAPATTSPTTRASSSGAPSAPSSASWDNDRAIAYRRLYDIPDTWGTAVNVQTMVFGNTGDDVGHRRRLHARPGHRRERLLRRVPHQRAGRGRRRRRAHAAPGDGARRGLPARLRAAPRGAPDARARAQATCRTSSSRSRRAGSTCSRRATASAPAWPPSASPSTWWRRASSTSEEALVRVEPEQLNQLLRPDLRRRRRSAAPSTRAACWPRACRPAPAPPPAGSSSTRPTPSSGPARGEKVLLVRDSRPAPRTSAAWTPPRASSPRSGGMTSHAALVARQMGKVCIVGCEALSIDYRTREATVAGRTFKEGDWLSIDGFTGEVIEGQLETRPSEVLQILLEGSMKPEDSQTYHYYSLLMQWADKARRLAVRTNADQPDQAENAIAFGAQGIGLCRTEHMFFGGDRITAVREMILADDEAGRRRALDKLLPMQRADFAGIFRAMGERPVTVRTLDPPLHEFLPHTEAEQREVADGDGRLPRGRRGEGRRPARAEPDAGPARLPPGHHLSRDHAHAGAGHHRGGLRREGRGPRRAPRDHDPARRHQEGARRPGGAGARRGRGGLRRARRQRRLPRGHDDRDPARRADGRRDRRDGRVLQLRHQRPHADDVSASRATTPASSCRST